MSPAPQAGWGLLICGTGVASVAMRSLWATKAAAMGAGQGTLRVFLWPISGEA